ncbi:MAG: hypothetical protein ACK5RI_01745, partial [Bacteroidota bacterium]
MSTVWKSFVYRNGYLLITAAWLYTLSFLFTNYWSYRSSPAKVKTTLEKRLSAENQKIDLLAADTLKLQGLLNSETPVVNPLKGETAIFLYEGRANANNARQLYWNSNHVYIDPLELNLEEGVYFVNHRNGDFQLVRKDLTLQGNPYTLIALVPIRWHYFMENKYLRTDFEGLEHLEDQYTISDAPGSL